MTKNKKIKKRFLEQFSYERYIKDSSQFEIDLKNHILEKTPMDSAFKSTFFYDSGNPNSKRESIATVEFLDLLKRNIILPFDWSSIYRSIKQYSFLDKIFGIIIFPGPPNMVDSSFILKPHFKSVHDISELRVILKGMYFERIKNETTSWDCSILSLFNDDLTIKSSTFQFYSITKNKQRTVIQENKFDALFDEEFDDFEEDEQKNYIPEVLVSEYLKNPSCIEYFSNHSFSIDSNTDPKKIWQLIQMQRI